MVCTFLDFKASPTLITYPLYYEGFCVVGSRYFVRSALCSSSSSKNRSITSQQWRHSCNPPHCYHYQLYYESWCSTKTSECREQLPVGTLDATFDNKVTIRDRTATPLVVFIWACGSTAVHSTSGAPVRLNPSTVMNMPEKNTSRAYDTWEQQSISKR